MFGNRTGSVRSGTFGKAFVKAAISFTYIRLIGAKTGDLINKITAGKSGILSLLEIKYEIF